MCIVHWCVWDQADKYSMLECLNNERTFLSYGSAFFILLLLMYNNVMHNNNIRTVLTNKHLYLCWTSVTWQMTALKVVLQINLKDRRHETDEHEQKILSVANSSIWTVSWKNKYPHFWVYQSRETAVATIHYSSLVFLSVYYQAYLHTDLIHFNNSLHSQWKCTRETKAFW